VEFLSARLRQFEPRLSDPQKALYLAAIGALRAERARELSLFSRISAAKEAVRDLEEAKRLSHGQVFVVRWMAGVVESRLPSLFGREEAARADLKWCLDNAEKAPGAGWLREVQRRLSPTASKDDPVAFNAAFSEDAAAGHTFSERKVSEPVPGRVYHASGYDFAELYFVVTGDGKELVAIDAGTRPDSLRAGWEALRAHAPALPPLTTVLVTHSHWDHVGGHKFFRSLASHPRFFSNRRSAEEIASELRAPGTLAPFFFGKRFDLEDVRSFTPDVTVDRPTDVTVGGTRFELVPVAGGETDDALLVNVSELGVMFAGDIAMPFFGAPFAEEGSVPGLVSAIDEVTKRQPRILLHGHEPLTRLYTPSVLARLKAPLAWLDEAVVDQIRHGRVRAEIQQSNLIAPGILEDGDLQLPYFVLREGAINRVYDRNVGYWDAELGGLDVLTNADRGAVLVDYLGVSERKLIDAVKRMVAGGDLELAAEVLRWTKTRHSESAAWREVERLTYRKLMERNQSANPFKFLLYAGQIGESVPQASAPAGGARDGVR
jgi:glyoxylase-like metal-dependent hydrolase (beta-lactamase superfamily II)